MEKTGSTVCVAGAAGYIGSSLLKLLLERGHTVHATLKNLEDKSEVDLLTSLPNAKTNLALFQADMKNPNDFDAAIKGCDYVLHLAHPMPYDPKSAEMDVVESSIAVMRSVANACIRTGTVKRLIYTSSVSACSPRNEDGIGYKSCIDESCWIPLSLSLTSHTVMLALVEKEALKYNENSESKLEVATLILGAVGGDTILNYLPGSVGAIISPVTGNLPLYYGAIKFMQEIMASVPIVHIEDVCEALIFCMEKPSIKGRFLCVVANTTMGEFVTLLKEYHPELKIDDESFAGESEEGIACSSKLTEIGFEYKCDLKKIIHDSLECGRRLGAIKS